MDEETRAQISEATTSSEVACFADDTKIYKQVDSIKDAEALQADLTSLAEWSESLALLFNRAKCKIQQVTRKKSPVRFPYSIQGDNLENCTEEKDLGVWISSDLKWSKQVYQQCSKANKLLGFARRSSREIQSTTTRRTLYLALVRPHLGYATQVWAPQSIELMRSVEQVQRRATKYVLKLPFQTEISYKERLQLCNFLPMTYWHEYLDLHVTFFFKAVNSLIVISSNVLPPLKSTVRITRSCSNQDISTFTPKNCRTVTYQRSFTVRTCRV